MEDNERLPDRLTDSGQRSFQEWRPVPGLPGIEASCFGHIVRDGRLLTQHVSDRGYHRVSLGGNKTAAVHRLVAMAHIENSFGYAEVNHLNGVKSDNTAANLEWCSRSQNMKHAYSIGLHPGVRLCGTESPNYGRKGVLHCQSMAVRATFADGSTKDYESQSMATADGFKPEKISMCINGHRRSHRGATWMPLPAPPVEGA